MAPLTALPLALALALRTAICAGSDYVEAVELYRSGDYPSAVETFEAIGAPVLPEAELDDDCVATLSLLDTEVGAIHATASRWSTAAAYFEAAVASSSRIRNESFRGRLKRDWLLFVGLLYQDLIFSAEPRGAIDGAEKHLLRAVEDYPRDPEVLVATGAFLEWASSVGLRRSAKRAENLYSEAIQIDPGLAAAHVRLGWVRLWQLENDAAARGPLTEGLRLAAEPILIYRARMGLGRLAEKDGHWEEAARHYEEAIAIAPGWQPGHIALAYALHRQGSRAQARNLLLETARIPDTDDNLLGWWSYELGSSPAAEGLLARMREGVEQ